MLEIVDYYIFNRSGICALLLDASIAFDRVNSECKLFAELLKRIISQVLFRLPIQMYSS